MRSKHALPAAFSVRHQTFQVVQNMWRRGGDAIDRVEDLPTSDRADLQPQPHGLIEILRIVVNGNEGLLEGLRALGRHARRGGEGPRQLVGEFGEFTGHLKVALATSAAVAKALSGRRCWR